MATITVGPTGDFPSIQAAMDDAGTVTGDTIELQAGYSDETATVTKTGLIISGDVSSTGIELELATGVANVTLAGDANINLLDAADGNDIVGNDGDNEITVTAGADAVAGGGGEDRLIVDWTLATGAVTGNSTSNFAEAGGGGRLVTINGGFEHFTVLTGDGADTITTGAGDDIIKAGNGANTIVAGQGANKIVGGSDADTVTALDGGNKINGGDGANTLTSGGGDDIIRGGMDADTMVAGGGADLVKTYGGADTADLGAGDDTLVADYSAFGTDFTGGVTGGTLLGGYAGLVADGAGNTITFVEAENFKITTGSGDDTITTGDGEDKLKGGDGRDTFDAAGGDDVVQGGAGRDSLTGGAGEDVLVGGADKDKLFGGADDDLFVYKALSDSAKGSGGRDAIKDFEDGDLIDLTRLDANADQRGNQAFVFVDDFSKTAGELEWKELKPNKYLVNGDVDGDGKADFAMVVKTTGGAPTADDFLL